MLKINQIYKKEVVPKMMERFGYKNILAVPKVKKIVVNIGIGKNKAEARLRESVIKTLQAITGQKPAPRSAKKSISGFKLRQGEEVGFVVNMHGQRMYDFLEKFVRIVLPRTKDFRGLKPSSLDKSGNLNIGIREQIIFPEIKQENIEKIHSLQVNIVTGIKDPNIAREFYKLLGFPFQA